MLKIVLILTLAPAFMIQCGSKRPQSGDGVARNDQQLSEKTNTENKRCDFSDVKPMRAGANSGAPRLSLPKPAYPPEAKERGIQGKVVVLLLVNTGSGLVERACVSEGNDLLIGAAKEAALRIKFSPYSSYIQERFSYAEEVVSYQFEAQ
jgi:outer membrane biosynthesis protein TonB